MLKTRWLLNLHPDFPSAQELLNDLHQPILLEREDVLKGNWPEVDGLLVGYGSMFCMTRLRRHPLLGRAVSDDYQLLRCSSYYRWTYDLLGRNCLLVPMLAISTLPLARIFQEGRVFLRSDSNYKLFPAELHQLGALPDFLERYQRYANEMVVLSEPIQIEREYRCFCRQASYVCGSSYPSPPFLSPPQEVRRMAEKTAARLFEQGIALASIDLAECTDGRLRLVEVGGVNSWGLYGSDRQAFIAALEAQAEEEQ